MPVVRNVANNFDDDALMKVSVILCTRNPQIPVLERVLAHLASQSLPRDFWEVVVVDNGSQPTLALGSVESLPHLRTIVEPETGLTTARIRGIREAIGDLVVFVDDDNLLDHDYLEKALRIAEQYPWIGTFGGRISPEFVVAEPAWLRPFRSHLALIEVDRDLWTNNPVDHGAIPCGAGLCVRREVAVAYAEAVASDRRRRTLDRAATGTLSCGDTDMVLTGLDAGWGTGRFTALHLTHVIPAKRVEFDYQRRLAADIGFSYGRLLAIRGQASRGRRAIALLKTVVASIGVRHRGKSRVLDLAYHFGYWRGLRSLS